MLKDLVKLANDLDAKGLKKEADALDKIISKTAGGLSSWQMLEYEEQRDEELKISTLILREAKRRSGRDDISKEMLSEFLEDIKSDVKKMVKDLTKSMNSFNMEPFEK